MRRSTTPFALALVAGLVALAPARAAAATYFIEVQSSPGGTVSPSGMVEVPAGGSQTFTFTPDGCNVVGDVTVDDVSVGVGLASYTFTNVQADHILYVPFGARATTTTLDIRPVVGQCAVPETLLATVPNADGGVVRFYRGTTLLASRTLVSGTASYVLASGLATGSYTFSASYSGIGCIGASASPELAYDVADTGPTPLTLALTLSTHLPARGSYIYADAQLRLGAAVLPVVGQVTYYDGATVVGTAPMSAGQSQLTIPMDTYGAHVITAVARPTLCVATTVASAPETANVVPPNRAPTSMTLTVQPATIDSGGVVLLRAQTSPPLYGRTIHFLDVTIGIEAGTVTVAPASGGLVSSTYGPLWSSRTIVARFDGDAFYKPCDSNPVTVTVIPPPAPVLFVSPFHSFLTEQNPDAVAAADFDGDGRLDLALPNALSDRVSELRGYGDGTFDDERPTAATGALPMHLAAGDLNGDGRPDLAVTAGDGVSVLLRTADGAAFAPRVDYTTGVATEPSSVAIGDLNGDGFADLAVANRGPRSQAYNLGRAVSILLGHGDGTFASHVDAYAQSLPLSVAIGDVDGDGRPDVVVACDSIYTATAGGAYAAGFIVLLGNGDGTLTKAGTFGTSQVPRALALADVNGDGRLDVVTANDDRTGSGSTASVFLGTGAGTFATPIVYEAGPGPRALAIGDLDSDGRPDLAVANGGDNTVSVMLGRGDGTFGTRRAYVTAGSCYGVATGDFDADGECDLAVANFNANLATVLLHLPTGVVATLEAAFEATPAADGIEVRWSFGDGSRVAASTVERSVTAAGPWLALEGEVRHEGDGFATVDRGAVAGRTWFYRLRVTLTDGSTTVFGPVSTATAIAGRTGVDRIAPNPARAASQIAYTLASGGRVRLEVTDVAGRVVATLFDGLHEAGRFELAWDGTSRGARVPAGLYFVRLITPERTFARKLARLQ